MDGQQEQAESRPPEQVALLEEATMLIITRGLKSRDRPPKRGHGR